MPLDSRAMTDETHVLRRKNMLFSSAKRTREERAALIPFPTLPVNPSL